MSAAQYRFVGTSTWYDFDGRHDSSATVDRVDLSQAYGNFDFRLVYKTGGLESAMATGTLAVYSPQLSNTTKSNVTGFTATSEKLSWTRLNSTDVPKFEYWNGTASRWDPLTVTTDGLYNHCVSIIGAAGTYDYRVTYTNASGQTAGFASGRLYAPGGTRYADPVVDVAGLRERHLGRRHDRQLDPDQQRAVSFEQRVVGTSAWIPLTVLRSAFADSVEIAC